MIVQPQLHRRATRKIDMYQDYADSRKHRKSNHKNDVEKDPSDVPNCLLRL